MEILSWLLLSSMNSVNNHLTHCVPKHFHKISRGAKLGLELLLGISMVNAWVVYKHVTKKTIKICTFREEVVKDLLQVRG